MLYSAFNHLIKVAYIKLSLKNSVFLFLKAISLIDSKLNLDGVKIQSKNTKSIIDGWQSKSRADNKTSYSANQVKSSYNDSDSCIRKKSLKITKNNILHSSKITT